MSFSGGVAGEVIAIDDVSVLDKPCDTAYFTIQDYSSLLASTSKGDSLYGPLQYTDDGYAFRLLVCLLLFLFCLFLLEMIVNLKFHFSTRYI